MLLLPRSLVVFYKIYGYCFSFKIINLIIVIVLCSFSRPYTIMNSQNARIVLDGFKIVMHSSEAIAPVGILHPLAFHLENKAESRSSSGIGKTTEICKEKVGFVFEVQGDCLHTCEATCQSAAEVTKLDEVAERRVHISRTKNHNTFSICCWLQDSCETSAGRMMILQ
jgi:hypothetical protein